MESSTTDNLISATQLCRATGIPVPTIYRLADRGKLPFVDATKDWHEKRFYLFDLDAVRAAVARMKRAG